MHIKADEDKDKKVLPGDPSSSGSSGDDTVVEDTDDEESARLIIEKLRVKLEESQKERQEYLEGWQRARADFVNARNEERKERQDLHLYAKTDVLSEILPIADNFERAFANKEAWEKVDENWRVGVEYIYAQLIKVLTDHGLEPIGTIGERFNPELHQSGEAIVTDKKEQQETIHSVVEKGYRYNGRIIRPAKVRVWHYEKINS